MPRPRKRPNPRLTANELALYMVSTDPVREGIIQRARDPKPYITGRYRDARTALCAFLADKRRSLSHLVNAENMLKQRAVDPALSCHQRNDASLSIQVLHGIQKMQNQLAGYDFLPAPRRQGKLYIEGVEVSVRADLIVHGKSGKVDQIGAAILRMAKDDPSSPTAMQRRKEMGQYTATLAHLHVQQNFASTRKPAPSLSMSIDVQHGEVFLSPARYSRRMRNIEAACRVIAMMW